MPVTDFGTACQHRWGSRVRLHEPLARHGTFAVGGAAEVWYTATTEEDVLAAVPVVHHAQQPLMFVGNGTNVLYADAGASGMVMKVDITNWQLTAIDETVGTCHLVVGAGVSLPKLVNELAPLGWSGMEWGAGVPGTIGGAIVSNAGCHGFSTSDNLLAARVLTVQDPMRPSVHSVPASELELAYRHSRFRAGRHVHFGVDGRPAVPPRQMIDPVEIVTGGIFLLQKKETSAIRERIVAYKQHRKDTQPPQPSAGSVFKNPTGDHAGRLIEAAGLKGHEIGRAAISAKHANFIVNLGGATAEDIVQLIALAHQTVQQRFGIDLDLELEPRGDW